MKRNPRRAYDREGREIAPPTIGSLREQGETTAAVFCHARECGHSAVISTDRFPADMPFPDIALHLRCSGCGAREVVVMKDMAAYYARCTSGVGTAVGLPPSYRVIGRDLPWPDEAPRTA
ncbi:hypothetical protein [Methylobacterium isbiliense]|uniref:Uncharacterized protein n=1 Tax=Methylobacterium isbiliense TaxID=315478 RepID=A0ABQ4S9Z3_9HYPH|nr:hypothetical protein [Methylobacterium isbiliense]MDN3625576.1 hypothetical protein [Methylobacterium isbiliense]GJE00011.1 hypothetical protein GMJLKIPL_1929 [Methylobacterium isbiliense]